MVPIDHRITEFQKLIINWYRKNGRKFYWRTESLNNWQWLVLELLLKRTRAEMVEKLFPSFISKYNYPIAIIQTSDIKLEKDLKFLGLQSQRRIAIKKIAETIMSKYGGKNPASYDSLMSLPYVGRYIANAVLCFSQNQRRPIVDVNIARVLTRFHGFEMPKDAREKWIWELAEKMLPEKNWKQYNYGLLDLGALICKSRVSKCMKCTLNDNCKYNKIENLG